MPGLTNPPGFGDSEWAEDRWARAQAMTGIKHLVELSSSWRPTRVATADRTINLAAGSATVGHGAVYDLTTGAGDNVQVQANATASIRYDLVVARWNWTTKARTFEVLTGSAVPPLINTTSAFAPAQVNRLIGNVYDGAIALVRVRPNVAVLAADDITDLRMFMDGSIPRMLSNYLRYCDFGFGQLVHTPGGMAKYTNTDEGIVQDRSLARRWNWGGVPYSWELNSGSWNKAPGSEGQFDTLTGHLYQITSKFAVNPVDGNAYIPWRFSTQIAPTVVNNSRYGLILEEYDGVTHGTTTAITHVSHYYAVAGGREYIAGMFAVAGRTRIAHSFISPSTTIVDLGPMDNYNTNYRGVVPGTGG